MYKKENYQQPVMGHIVKTKYLYYIQYVTMTMTMNLFPIYNIYNTHTYNMTIIIN